MAELMFRKQAQERPHAAQRRRGPVLQDNRATPRAGARLQDNRAPVQRNRTGLPDRLKSGVENLSGISMDHVRVHYNSARPATLQAHAYAQGSEIHLAPGQEKHLPHEAWHVVQQAQGRVRPGVQMKAGASLNTDAGLEHEADVMGARAWQEGPPAQARAAPSSTGPDPAAPLPHYGTHRPVLQRKITNYKPSKKSTVVSPRDQLKAKLDKTKFVETAAQVDANIEQRLQIHGNISIANKVKATIEKKATDVPPPRSGNAQNIIGTVGRDEFYTRTAGTHAFEGGHVIPLSAWDHGDTKVAEANKYDNLVPMSRTLNIGMWAVAEEKMKDGTKRNWDIDIDRDDYKVPYGQVAKDFNLNLNNAAADRAQTITMAAVTPTLIVADPNSLATLPVITREPATIAPAADMISSGAQLKAFLIEKAGWEYLSDAVRTAVSAIP